MKARHISTLFILLSLSSTIRAQQPGGIGTQGKPRPIQDNSFLIEEAYNQDSGMVQHTSTFSRSWETKIWIYSFTQEWPIASLKHQFSFSLPVLGINDGSTTGRGVGDIALNYRYQLTGNSDSRLLIAPRVGILLPTGSYKRAFGVGGVGFQFNLPVTVVLSDHFVTHSNAGFTITARARTEDESEVRIKAINLGQSLIWLAHTRFNVMFETLWIRSVSKPALGTMPGERNDTLFMNPGVRWSYDVGGLQIVPGVSIPIGLGPSRGDVGLMFYLAFEHPFRFKPRKGTGPAKVPVAHTQVR